MNHKEPLATRSYWSEHGKSSFEVLCPFCQDWTRVFAWSFQACGKKCYCGAILHINGAKKTTESEVQRGNK